MWPYLLEERQHLLAGQEAVIVGIALGKQLSRMRQRLVLHSVMQKSACSWPVSYHTLQESAQHGLMGTLASQTSAYEVLMERAGAMSHCIMAEVLACWPGTKRPLPELPSKQRGHHGLQGQLCFISWKQEPLGRSYGGGERL